MTRLFASPYFRITMMLGHALLALEYSMRGAPLPTCLFMSFSAYAMFRVWGGLRERSEP
jgi:hypothetical protein